jgi:hypothetical protein
MRVFGDDGAARVDDAAYASAGKIAQQGHRDEGF